MALEPRRGGVEAYFTTKSDKDGIFTAGDYQSRLGMSYSRFKNLTENLAFGPPIQRMTAETDGWQPIRAFLDSFQANLIANLTPGRGFCVDEFMSPFGVEDIAIDGNVYGLPHQSKIERKPKGVGAEAKCVYDIDTGIMISFEFMEGEDAMRNRPYVQQYGSSTAHVLR
jgi:hypothetical protein